MATNNYLEKIQAAQIQRVLQERNGKRLRLRWSTPKEVRLSLSKINNMLANNEIPAKSANAIFFSANLILEALKMEKDSLKGK